jgi:hypothetical protein
MAFAKETASPSGAFERRWGLAITRYNQPVTMTIVTPTIAIHRSRRDRLKSLDGVESTTHAKIP